jgi:hypothetical protein
MTQCVMVHREGVRGAKVAAAPVLGYRYTTPVMLDQFPKETDGNYQTAD